LHLNKYVQLLFRPIGVTESNLMFSFRAETWRACYHY